jgi:hypothetical protein
MADAEGLPGGFRPREGRSHPRLPDRGGAGSQADRRSRGINVIFANSNIEGGGPHRLGPQTG